MANKILLVDSVALPDVFEKVVEAKKLLATGEAKTASEASRMCGISRSAYYKYKNSVFEYSRPIGKTLSLQAVLRDKAGVLSAFLQQLYNYGANLLTVNQGLPTSGIASVSVSLKVLSDDVDISEMLHSLNEIDGVISVKQIHAEQ